MQIKELGHIVLFVSALEKCADFYREMLGFREIDRGEGYALFGSFRTHHELLLLEVGGEPKPTNYMQPGLYHFGLKIGDGPEALKAAYAELKSKSVRIIGTADHHVTHSLYILDPDNNEIELYADIKDDWKHDPKSIMQPARPLNLEE